MQSVIERQIQYDIPAGDSSIIQERQTITFSPVDNQQVFGPSIATNVTKFAMSSVSQYLDLNKTYITANLRIRQKDGSPSPIDLFGNNVGQSGQLLAAPPLRTNQYSFFTLAQGASKQRIFTGGNDVCYNPNVNTLPASGGPDVLYATFGIDPTGASGGGAHGHAETGNLSMFRYGPSMREFMNDPLGYSGTRCPVPTHYLIVHNMATGETHRIGVYPWHAQCHSPATAIWNIAASDRKYAGHSRFFSASTTNDFASCLGGTGDLNVHNSYVAATTVSQNRGSMKTDGIYMAQNAADLLRNADGTRYIPNQGDAAIHGMNMPGGAANINNKTRWLMEKRGPCGPMLAIDNLNCTTPSGLEMQLNALPMIQQYGGVRVMARALYTTHPPGAITNGVANFTSSYFVNFKESYTKLEIGVDEATVPNTWTAPTTRATLADGGLTEVLSGGGTAQFVTNVALNSAANGIPYSGISPEWANPTVGGSSSPRETYSFYQKAKYGNVYGDSYLCTTIQGMLPSAVPLLSDISGTNWPRTFSGDVAFAPSVDSDLQPLNGAGSYGHYYQYFIQWNKPGEVPVVMNLAAARFGVGTLATALPPTAVSSNLTNPSVFKDFGLPVSNAQYQKAAGIYDDYPSASELNVYVNSTTGSTTTTSTATTVRDGRIASGAREFRNYLETGTTALAVTAMTKAFACHTQLTVPYGMMGYGCVQTKPIIPRELLQPLIFTGSAPGVAAVKVGATAASSDAMTSSATVGYQPYTASIDTATSDTAVVGWSQFTPFQQLTSFSEQSTGIFLPEIRLCNGAGSPFSASNGPLYNSGVSGTHAFGEATYKQTNLKNPTMLWALHGTVFGVDERPAFSNGIHDAIDRVRIINQSGAVIEDLTSYWAIRAFLNRIAVSDTHQIGVAKWSGNSFLTDQEYDALYSDDGLQIVFQLDASGFMSQQRLVPLRYTGQITIELYWRNPLAAITLQGKRNDIKYLWHSKSYDRFMGIGAALNEEYHTQYDPFRVVRGGPINNCSITTGGQVQSPVKYEYDYNVLNPKIRCDVITPTPSLDAAIASAIKGDGLPMYFDTVYVGQTQMSGDSTGVTMLTQRLMKNVSNAVGAFAFQYETRGDNDQSVDCTQMRHYGFTQFQYTIGTRKIPYLPITPFGPSSNQRDMAAMYLEVNKAFGLEPWKNEQFDGLRKERYTGYLQPDNRDYALMCFTPQQYWDMRIRGDNRNIAKYTGIRNYKQKYLDSGDSEIRNSRFKQYETNLGGDQRMQGFAEKYTDSNEIFRGANYNIDPYWLLYGTRKFSTETDCIFGETFQSTPGADMAGIATSQGLQVELQINYDNRFSSEWALGQGVIPDQFECNIPISNPSLQTWEYSATSATQYDYFEGFKYNGVQNAAIKNWFRSTYANKPVGFTLMSFLIHTVLILIRADYNMSKRD